MKKTVELLKMVKDNPEAAVNKVLQQLDKMSYRMVEISKVKSMVNEAKMVAQHQLLTAEAKLVNKTLTDEQRAVLIEEVIDLQKIADNMEEMTKHMNAYSGRDLQDIQNWILYKTKQGETLSKEAIAEAHLKYYNKKYAQIVSERAPEVERLLNTGKFDEAMALINKSEQSDEVQAALKGIEKYDPDQAAKLRNDPQANASLMDKTSEAAIASMFNMTTIQYNTIIPLLKTYTMPLLDTLAQNPLSLNAWRKTMYQYSVMNAYQTHAVNAWRIAQHLEHTTLTSDPARFYDGGVKNKGGFWAVWRIMTRMVAGSDGYLQELIASSYMSAKAFDEIVTEASEKGLKGKELKDAVNIDAIFNRMKEGYDYHLTEQKLKPIIERANNMKLKGEKKEAYILARLQDMGREGLKNLTDEGALDLVRSLLYKNKLKRVFKDSSGKAHWENQFKDSPLRHTAERYESATAAWEDLMKDHPFYRLLLTPFWRTPVRLVNEAIRLSPFLQQMHPTFMDDLAGVNGMARQARASSEAMVAHSWLMYVTVKYAQGEITGSGDVDFTKKMQNTNSGVGLPPHVIEWSEGNGMSYLRAEPIRLPTQLWIDTLENYRKRTVKQGMGGYGDEMDLQEEFMADMGVVLGALLTTVQDTQLLKGITDIVKMGGDTFDTFRTEDDSTEGFEPLLKYWTKKAMMVVPAQPRKTVQAISAHEKTRAFDATDRFVQMLTPNHESIPREYDWRFKPMQMHDPMIAVWGFSTHDYYQGNGFTEEEKEIDQYFRMLEKNDIAHVSRNWFKSPSHFGNEDMRNLDIEYVSESGAVRTQHIYALVHEEAAKMNKNGAYTRTLLNIIRADKPLGTPDGAEDSPKIADLKQAMSLFKNQVMKRLLSNPRYAEAKKLVIQTRHDNQNDAMRN